MKSAVIVIDLQRGLVEEDPKPFEIKDIINRINRITTKARLNGDPVILVQHEQSVGLLAFGGEGWQLSMDLAVNERDIIVRKKTPDSFHNTDLEQKLNQNEVDNLIICGYASEFCVDTTIRRAVALGFQVQIASDAHTTHDKDHASAAQIREHHNKTLPNITSFGPKIKALSTDELLEIMV